VRDGGLHAEGDPGEARVGQQLEGFRGDGVRVGLRGHLGAGSRPQVSIAAREDPGKVLGGQQRGRAAAEEHRAQLAGGQPRMLKDPRGKVTSEMAVEA
jgi:hypothetical protein